MEKRESADQTLRKIANDGLMNRGATLPLKTAVTPKMLNILSDGISVKTLMLLRYRNQKPEAVQWQY